MHCKWQPISPEWIPRSQSFSADSICNDSDKKDNIRIHTYLRLMMYDGVATQPVGSVLTGLDKLQHFAVCCFTNSATTANSVVLV